MDRLLDRLIELSSVPNDLLDRDFLLSWKKSDAALKRIRLTAGVLREMWKNNLSARVFESGMGLSIFRDHSTRTRYAFRSACNLLGLATEELDEKTSQIAHGETVRETATMISFLTEVVGIRDDMFLGEGHRYMSEFSGALEESHHEGVLHQRTGVVNLQCDLDHPTQSLSDLCHLCDVFGGIEKLAGKKLVMSWAYSPSYGKPLSVAQGIVTLATRFGMNVVLAHPEGYDLADEPMQAARSYAKESGGSFQVSNSMREAFEGADIVYPKSWAPVSVMRKRTQLLRAGESRALDELEAECLAQNARYVNWEANEELHRSTRDGAALYMHCLPADISGLSCEQGEVSRGLFERFRLKTYQEASYKPFVIAAMILNMRFKSPADVLKTHIVESRYRTGER